MKRKIFNRFLSFTLASAMTFSCAALQTYAGANKSTKVTAYEEQGTAYPVEGGNIYISGTVLTKADENITSVVVPDFVTEIGSYAFEDCASLESITLPDGVITIGDHAFDYCTGLKSISLPNSVKTIGEHAFFSCESLESITLPESLESIGEDAFSFCVKFVSVDIPAKVTYIHKYAFDFCDELSAINVSAENQSYTSVDGVLYTKDLKTLIKCPQKTALKELVIPNGTEYISDHACEECEGLESVKLPDTLKDIDWNAFAYCKNLKKIDISAGVESIDHSAFTECTALEEINADGQNKTFASDKGILYTKDMKTLVLCPEGYAAESVSVPDGVTNISTYAFAYCQNIRDVKLPDSVVNIGECAFQVCENLKSINIPDGVVSIEHAVFVECNSLGNVTIPDSVTTIGEFAFAGCESFTDISIPDSVTFIDAFAFNGCKNLKSIRLSENIKAIPNYLLSKCTSLESIEIPDGVTSVGKQAFADCTALKSITIPDSVTNIDEQAFENVTNAQIYCKKGSAADDISLYGENCTFVYTGDSTTKRPTDVKAEVYGESGLTFTAGADSLDYKEVGFILDDILEETRRGTKTVYTSIEESSFTPADFENAEYIYSFTVEDIPYDFTDIEVTPYFIDLSGNEVLGKTKRYCIRDLREGIKPYSYDETASGSAAEVYGSETVSGGAVEVYDTKTEETDKASEGPDGESDKEEAIIHEINIVEIEEVSG